MRKGNAYSINNMLMYALLFVCLTTSHLWAVSPSAQGEIFRFDRILLFGQATIYHLFAMLFFLIIFFVKFGPNNDGNILGDRNYLKNIFWMYFIPVNILQYLAVYIKDITLIDLGVAPIMAFFVYLSVTFYIQDVFLKNKDSKQLVNILTILEVLILFRCCYSIIKYLLGLGSPNPIVGGIRLGTEDDFSDFFILLFIIALTRLLFVKNESKRNQILHILGIITSSCVAIFSFRRYFWGELLVAIVIISFFYLRFVKVNINKKIAVPCFLITFIIVSILFAGPHKITENYYVGRLLTSFSLLNPQYESKYGTDMGHRAEIEDGWYNVKRNWLLGITPFGGEKVVRFETAQWQPGLYVHNAYLNVWLIYGLLGLFLFIFLYFKSIQLGYIVFFKFKDNIGLILIAFMICQMVKNVVWPTAITNINVTIIYIFLISIVLKMKQLESYNQIKK